jgi:hypothetical protein
MLMQSHNFPQASPHAITNDGGANAFRRDETGAPDRFRLIFQYAENQPLPANGAAFDPDTLELRRFCDSPRSGKWQSRR